MKTSKIAVAAMAVLCAVSFVSSCHKVKEQEKPVVEQETEFTVALNTVEAEYAEIVVRHTGAKDVTWFGFVTEDVTTSEQDLINAQVAKLDKKALHVGNSQTVAVRNLSEKANYRYIAFAVNASNEVFGKPGSITFSTSPKLNVVFEAEATEVKAHEASFTISHAGNEVLTYTCFVTTDTQTSAKELAQSDFAYCVTDGKLNEDVVLLSGNSKAVTIDELDGDTDYRFIVYGIFENNGSYVYYGTPADVAFSTPIDLATVKFSAVASNIDDTSADVTVSYSASVENLTWYGFVTDDITTETSALIAAKVATISESDWQAGPKTVSLTGLTTNTDYRYIVTGINADGVYGVAGEVAFKAYVSEAYAAWLGTWYIPTTVYQYDSNDEYIGDAVEMLPIVISKDVVNESYLISGIGPKNDKYDVSAYFVDDKLVVHPYTVYTWTHAQAGEIKELLAGLYGEGDDAMWTWDSSLTLFTGTIGADGNATLTPGQSSSGETFNGFQFIQYYSAGAYGYGGNYALPNTMSRTQSTSSAPVANRVKSAFPVRMQKEALTISDK